MKLFIINYGKRLQTIINFLKKEDKNINERSESKKSENKKNEISERCS